MAVRPPVETTSGSDVLGEGVENERTQQLRRRARERESERGNTRARRVGVREAARAARGGAKLLGGGGGCPSESG